MITECSEMFSFKNQLRLKIINLLLSFKMFCASHFQVIKANAVTIITDT